MKTLTPYLHFDGSCREAMDFYRDCLGGTLQVITYGQMDQDAPAEAKDRTAHSYLENDRIALMGSDGMPGWPFQATNSTSLNLHCESIDELNRLFDRLAQKGSALARPEKASWGGHFAMVTDRYGVHWMLTCPENTN